MANHYVDWLRYGKPEMGWSGDPMLSLAFHRIENRWELWRNEPVAGQPDRHILVAKGPVGADLNDDAVNLLIMNLVRSDTHARGNSAEDIVENVLKTNEKLEKDRETAAMEETSDALAKFYTEAGKVLGVTKTTWAI